MIREIVTALLIAKVEQLTADVQTLLQRVPSNQRKWITPNELASRAGVTVRTIANWRESVVIKPSGTTPGVSASFACFFPMRRGDQCPP